MRDPAPICKFGYSFDQLTEMLSEVEYIRLMKWMYGQTMSICEGQAPCEMAHGYVVYPHDFERWRLKLPVID